MWDTTYETQMASFDFLYGVILGYELLKHSDNLSKALQHKYMSASEGYDIAHLTVYTLSKLRTEDANDQFWGSIDTKLDNVDVNEPTLPRRRKLPKLYETGDADYEYPSSSKDLYRQQYFEALDMAINYIQDRFDQLGFLRYRRLQDSLLKSAVHVEDPTAADDIKHGMYVYKGDINEVAFGAKLDSLRTLLQRRYHDLNSVILCDIVKVFQDMKPTSRLLFSEVVTVLKRVLVMSATNATSERSFSALRRLKTFLRSTMTQGRLTHWMILHVHKETTDIMNLETVANEFVSDMEHRVSIFAKFWMIVLLLVDKVSIFI